MFLALCDGTYEEMYAVADTEKEAVRLLFTEVKNYLIARQAPETSEMSIHELEDYFGYVVIPIKSGEAGFVRG